MINNHSCFLCLSTEDIDQCNKCGNIFSCKQHLKTHITGSDTCYPYRVQYDCEMGRYLVATRNIKQGETILHEDPLVLGPYTRSKPQCLNCFISRVQQFPPTVSGKHQVERCFIKMKNTNLSCSSTCCFKLV